MEALSSSLAPWAIPALFACCFGGLAYALFSAWQDAMDHYADTYTADTSRKLEDVFLFIPPARILYMARLAAAALFLILFLAVGNLRSARGMITGFVFGLAGAGLALNAPRIVLKILRDRRLRKFNDQLVDALSRMSNSLPAGFSIMQSFEAIVREGQNPIAQEFGMFLHQTRVGVRFEDALNQLEKRVGSEDLTLAVRAIETARQTGGSLTEVFDKIAVVIRERMRLHGRIRSLTAEGRLQGIVVGALPIILLVALAFVDPDMMGRFFSSPGGLGILGLAVVLEILGFLLIRKIMRIDV
jgi:tight adherence protein B